MMLHIQHHFVARLRFFVLSCPDGLFFLYGRKHIAEIIVLNRKSMKIVELDTFIAGLKHDIDAVLNTPEQ